MPLTHSPQGTDHSPIVFLFRSKDIPDALSAVKGFLRIRVNGLCKCFEKVVGVDFRCHLPRPISGLPTVFYHLIAFI
jgi:hypothetical protein